MALFFILHSPAGTDLGTVNIISFKLGLFNVKFNHVFVASLVVLIVIVVILISLLIKTTFPPHCCYTQLVTKLCRFI